MAILECFSYKCSHSPLGVKEGGWRSLREYIRAFSPPSKTPFRFILNRLVIIWVHLVGFWQFRPCCQILLFSEHFKLRCCFWNYLLFVIYLTYWKLGSFFCWSLVFYWSFFVFWTNLVLILESWLCLSRIL